MGDAPLFLKCCWFVSLRCYLIIWSLIKLVGDLFFILFLIVLPLNWFIHHHESILAYRFSAQEIMYLLFLVLLAVDCFWILLLMVGVCWKKHTALLIFFYYGIFMIAAETSIITFIVGWSFYQYHLTRWKSTLLFMSLGILWIGIDFTIMLTLTSEIRQLRNKEEYNFTGVVYNAQPNENYTENNLETNEKRENEEETHLNPHEIKINKYESIDSI